ncbi:hypothetical protein ATCC90586_003604 [Pythium insidiosum]|nr:hypothetical protein ATCC90586_003604 [Pythium insidiosum]
MVICQQENKADQICFVNDLRYKPILSRIYDFQFSIRGFSVTHFERFDFLARRRWYTHGHVNLNNFGPAAREFTEDIRGYSQWTGADIVTLAFWFDGVLKDFRRAVESDLRNGTTTCATVRDQFSFQDPQLQALTLQDLVALWRNETEDDPCLNPRPSVARHLGVEHPFDSPATNASTNPIGLLIDHNEPLFSINVREALSVVFEAVTWAKYWQRFSQHSPVVIRCLLDNASAVSWFNRRYSADPAGQELARVLSCAELEFNISFSAACLRTWI